MAGAMVGHDAGVARRRRLVVGTVVVAAVGAGCAWVSSDPVRLGVTIPPFADDADRGDAYVVAQVERGIRDTLGPYSGPTFALTDLPTRFDVVGPTGQHTGAELIEVTTPLGHDFTAEAHGILRMQGLFVSWFLPTGSQDPDLRCRSVTIRYHSDADIETRRVDCPPSA